jgi:hypothetical protein
MQPLSFEQLVGWGYFDSARGNFASTLADILVGGNGKIDCYDGGGILSVNRKRVGFCWR